MAKKRNSERVERPSKETIQKAKGIFKYLHLDHICRNDTNQTAFAIASILERVCHAVSTKIPSLKRVILCSDNAANYGFNLLPVIAPIIMKTYGMEPVRIIDNKTQDGKGLADIHFATAF